MDKIGDERIQKFRKIFHNGIILLCVVNNVDGIIVYTNDGEVCFIPSNTLFEIKYIEKLNEPYFKIINVESENPSMGSEYYDKIDVRISLNFFDSLIIDKNIELVGRNKLFELRYSDYNYTNKLFADIKNQLNIGEKTMDKKIYKTSMGLLKKIFDHGVIIKFIVKNESGIQIKTNDDKKICILPNDVIFTIMYNEFVLAGNNMGSKCNEPYFTIIDADGKKIDSKIALQYYNRVEAVIPLELYYTFIMNKDIETIKNKDNNFERRKHTIESISDNSLSLGTEFEVLSEKFIVNYFPRFSLSFESSPLSQSMGIVIFNRGDIFKVKYSYLGVDIITVNNKFDIQINNECVSLDDYQISIGLVPFKNYLTSQLMRRIS
jgi:hypothetical protein